MSADPTPVANALLEFAQDAATGATEIVPRFLERSRRQIRFAAKVVGHLPCVGRAVPTSLKDGASVGDGSDLADFAPSSDGVGDNGSTPVDQPSRPQSGPAAATLAITDYDSLAASQVLPRLDGLTGEELEAVRRYESEHRGRRTILGRIAQLQV